MIYGLLWTFWGNFFVDAKKVGKYEKIIIVHSTELIECFCGILKVQECWQPLFYLARFFCLAMRENSAESCRENVK